MLSKLYLCSHAFNSFSPKYFSSVHKCCKFSIALKQDKNHIRINPLFLLCGKNCWLSQSIYFPSFLELESVCHFIFPMLYSFLLPCPLSEFLFLIIVYWFPNLHTSQTSLLTTPVYPFVYWNSLSGYSKDSPNQYVHNRIHYLSTKIYSSWTYCCSQHLPNYLNQTTLNLHSYSPPTSNCPPIFKFRPLLCLSNSSFVLMFFAWSIWECNFWSYSPQILLIRKEITSKLKLVIHNEDNIVNKIME